MNTITLPYNSNDAHIWTNIDPDLELIEPRILVSINRNYLVYGRKLGRPPQNHQLTIVNHGEHPIAFKVMTTDNYAYFVNQAFGIIPGRHLHAIPHVRAPNQFTLQVNRRPYNCFCDEQQPSHWNTPRKDKLFILLASVFSFNIPPAALFTHEGCYEKLRVCLEYTGMPTDPAKDVSLIFKRFPGWCTWAVEKKREASWELMGKTKEEVKRLIINKPCPIPLKFEEIPEPPKFTDLSNSEVDAVDPAYQVDQEQPSKKKRGAKQDKPKAKAAEIGPRTYSPPPEEAERISTSERRGRKFTGKLGVGKASGKEKPMISLSVQLQEHANKQAQHRKEASQWGDAPTQVFSVMKAPTQVFSVVKQPKPEEGSRAKAARSHRSTIRELKNLFSLRGQRLHSKERPRSAEPPRQASASPSADGNFSTTSTQCSRPSSVRK